MLRGGWATPNLRAPSLLLPAHVAVERPQLNRGNIRNGERFCLPLMLAYLTTNANLRLTYAFRSPICSLLD